MYAAARLQRYKLAVTQIWRERARIGICQCRQCAIIADWLELPWYTRLAVSVLDFLFGGFLPHWDPQDELLFNCITDLWTHLKSLGVQIEVCPDLDVAGRIFYKEKLILLSRADSLGSLMALAHEGGHYLHYLRNPDLEENRSQVFRERGAYLLGWTLLRRVGAVQDSLVTKELWREWGIDEEFR